MSRIIFVQKLLYGHTKPTHTGLIGRPGPLKSSVMIDPYSHRGNTDFIIIVYANSYDMTYNTLAITETHRISDYTTE